ncbi:hypothetical protein [Thermococcus sp. 9N3]|uniref:hypothetical protein n=1 Tax=Thermococcus sp. 9N3 TaxID=163002 RepID=UPI001431F8F0|nr:hypothetical protein [Thermococcus sp. 9N3]NJE48731.1 hypothetical protein [Thermococcus sp. 9N3]
MRTGATVFLLLLLVALLVHQLVSHSTSCWWSSEVNPSLEPGNGTVYVYFDGGGNTYLYLPVYLNGSLRPLGLTPIFVDWNASNVTGNVLIVSVPFWGEFAGFLSVTYRANVTIEYYKNASVREVVLRHVNGQKVPAELAARAHLTVTMRAGYLSKFDPYLELAKLISEKTGKILRTSDKP